MNILYIEPYFADSHKRWIESYRKHSKHKIDILSLPGNKWKWRMHGGAITLSEMFKRNKEKYDLLICSDFLNLPVFKSMCLKELDNVPIAMYFHENQLAYPWPEHDDDLKLKRDLHYHYINQTSAMAADWNYFNSKYNLESFKNELAVYLKKMPDFQNLDSVDRIDRKSSVLHLGCNLSAHNEFEEKYENEIPVILWNHRWEYDKNPNLFFETLFKIKDNGGDFKLVLLGEKFSSYPDIFNIAEQRLKENILHIGYCDSFKEYSKWLWKSDILPVTSNQDFFGISIVEASYCNTYPILPKKLSYPELFNAECNSSIFYENKKDFYEILSKAIQGHLKLKNYSNLMKIYDWKTIVSKYDKTFEKLAICP